MSITILSQVAKLNSVYRPTCILILKSILDSKGANNTRLLLKIASKGICELIYNKCVYVRPTNHARKPQPLSEKVTDK